MNDAPPPAEHSLLRRMRLRAFDLSLATTRLGRASAERRLGRLRGRSFLIVQCAVTAGIAWALARLIPGHQAPFFAPIAAIICLGVTFGNRLRRGVEVAIGVAVGVGVGDVFVSIFGSGVWQIVVVVAIAMSVATLVGAGQLIIIQGAVQSIVVTTLLPNPGLGFNRWLDAVVGCVIALAIATIAPSAPLRRPGILAAQVLTDMAEALEATVAALRDGDEDQADIVLDRVRGAEGALDTLESAAEEGLAVVRYGPFRRGQVSTLQAYADITVPIGRAYRNLRVLVRRSAVAVWRHESVPPGYLSVLIALAQSARTMAGELYEGRLPVNARKRLQTLGEQSAHLPIHESMSAVVILAQCRSIIVDLMEVTGLDAADARESVPGMD